jgi:putative ubiquitin-RnfH superfamily antitoxin RatB of RatAB toxin-antitoxin module
MASAELDAKLHVHLVYASADNALMRLLTVAPGTTIEQAIIQSGVLDEIDGLDLAINPVGIYGKKRPLDTVLRDRDRIEIYRPLVADPKESRRKRAGRNKAQA